MLKYTAAAADATGDMGTRSTNAHSLGQLVKTPSTAPNPSEGYSSILEGKKIKTNKQTNKHNTSAVSSIDSRVDIHLRKRYVAGCGVWI